MKQSVSEKGDKKKNSTVSTSSRYQDTVDVGWRTRDRRTTRTLSLERKKNGETDTTAVVRKFKENAIDKNQNGREMKQIGEKPDQSKGMGTLAASLRKGGVELTALCGPFCVGRAHLACW